MFPSFRAFLFAPAGSAEEAEKKEALLAELAALNTLLSQPGAVRRTPAPCSRQT